MNQSLGLIQEVLVRLREAGVNSNKAKIYSNLLVWTSLLSIYCARRKFDDIHEASACYKEILSLLLTYLRLSLEPAPAHASDSAFVVRRFHRVSCCRCTNRCTAYGNRTNQGWVRQIDHPRRQLGQCSRLFTRNNARYATGDNGCPGMSAVVKKVMGLNFARWANNRKHGP